MHRLQELVRLHRMGQGAREAARLLGMGPNTEREYRKALAEAGLLDGDPAELPDAEALKQAILRHRPPVVPEQQTSSLEHWQKRIESLSRAGVGPRAIYDRLRTEDKDFNGSLSAVKRMVLRLKREAGPNPLQVAIPVETVPGDVAQVDFGYAGYRWDSQQKKLRKSWVFVMVLGHSRHLYAECAFRQDTNTWIALHERAFRALGGVPRTIVPDNLKAAVIRAAFDAGGTSELNRSYREVARHYQFKIDPTPPRAPKKKGKVEAGVKYVKSNALSGRSEEPLEDTNRWLERWTREVAGMRIHGTTGKQPLMVFESEEQRELHPLPPRPYDPVVWKKATVHPDSHVVFEKRLYSVPWPHIGRQVWVRATVSSVMVYVDDERVATHARAGSGHRVTEESHLPEVRGDFRHRTREYWEERADRMGDEVGAFVREVFDSDGELSMLRPVQSIVSLLEQYPVERARATAARSRFYGSYNYRAVKSILVQGLDFQPLPPVRPGSGEWADEPPRFARPETDWLTEAEVSHEHH